MYAIRSYYGVYKFNQGACTRKSWFDCSCCPTNLIRFIPSIPGLIYSKSAKDIYVNLYASNEAKIAFNGEEIKIAQNTNYPWDGKVTLTISPTLKSEFTLKLRVPGWSRNEVLPSDLYAYSNKMKEQPKISLNGEKMNTDIQNGYFVVTRAWEANDRIELNFPMEVRTVQAHENVEEDIGKLSLEYGPLVYRITSYNVCYTKLLRIGRRSFATNSYGTVPTLTIMKITGHKSEQVFLNYIKTTPMEYAKEMKKSWEK